MLKSIENIVLLENRTNLGFLKTANIGLFFSDSDYVCLLNSDTIIVDGQWLDKMIRFADGDPSVGLVSPLSNEAVNLTVKMHPGADIRLMAGLINEYSAGKYPDAVTVVGFCLLIKRAVIDKIGGFDEIFEKGYCEESDYQYRAIDAGFTCKVCDDTFVYHEGEGSFTGERDHRYTRNRKIFDEKWLPHYEKDIRMFNEKNELSYLRNEDFTLRRHRIHENYDILFLLLNFETYGGVIVVADIVNQLILNNVKANVVYLSKTENPINIKRYFEPLYIPEDEITDRMPKSKLYVATHYRTAVPVFQAAHKHRGKACYLIQDDERKFENENIPLAESTYSLIPNHVYVSDWLEKALGSFARFKKVISNGIDRDLFYPGRKADRDDRRLNVAMMTRSDKKRGYYEGITAINRLLSEKGNFPKPFFHFFGNREVFAHEIKSDQFKYYGILNRKAVAGIFRNADILIDPSHFQGFGLTALEAMSCGCACILPKDGGVNDFAIHLENAVLFDGLDVGDLYQKIRLLFDCPEARIGIQKKAVELADRFNIHTSARKYAFLI